MRCVAPSPSAGIDWARSSQTSNSVVRKSSSAFARERGGDDSPCLFGGTVRQQKHRIVRAHVAIDADAMKRFFHRIDECRLGILFSQRASVITSESIVAMLGPIIAAPLAMPVTRVGTPPIVTSRPQIFGTVSVVMMPRAAFSSDCGIVAKFASMPLRCPRESFPSAASSRSRRST